MPIMPSLFRFLSIVCVFTLAILVLLWSLATFIEPHPRPITISIPVDLPQK